MSDLDNLARDYRTAFLRYLPHRSEAAMTAGHELGRLAPPGGASLLDLVHVHHRVLSEVLVGAPAPDAGEVTAAASEFLSGPLDLRQGPPRAPRPAHGAQGR